ncbi:MAG: sigma-54 dependent transcriptional regulator, partial [Desulfovibrionaceae bacterium]
MSPRTLLFVAEPQAITDVFPRIKEYGLEAGIADNLAGAINFIKKSDPLLVFSRPHLQTYRVEGLLEAAAEDPDFPPIVVFARQGSAEQAQRYLELGAKDYWLDPIMWDKIKVMIPAEQAEEEEAGAPSRSAASAKAAGGTGKQFSIIGRHTAVKRVLALAKQVAKSRATVLISGESGTGKEMFARFLHFHSDRSEMPFVGINCAALPEHLLESELFGHEKGAFTGAISRKLGKFELATGGTMLLDEISEMNLGLQAKLLRVLQEGEIDRVGGVETVSVDVRVLATTNRNIEESVKSGEFRQDLFYRLNVIPLRLPPLRERGDDVVLLARHFVANFCKGYGMDLLAFSPEAEQWLKSYDWPGNVRELQNLMERAVLLAGGRPIQPAHFLLDPDSFEPEDMEAMDQAQGTGEAPAEEGTLAVMPLHEMEKKLIIKSLDQTSGNRTRAAELLGISVRTLRNKLNA